MQATRVSGLRLLFVFDTAGYCLDLICAVVVAVLLFVFVGMGNCSSFSRSPDDLSLDACKGSTFGGVGEGGLS